MFKPNAYDCVRGGRGSNFGGFCLHVLCGCPLRKRKSQIKYEAFYCSETQSHSLMADSLYSYFLLSKSLPTKILEDLKLDEKKFVLEELQNRYWQYLTENLISSIRNKKKLLNATRKKRSKNNKRH